MTTLDKHSTKPGQLQFSIFLSRLSTIGLPEMARRGSMTPIVRYAGKQKTYLWGRMGKFLGSNIEQMDSQWSTS
jgi:hypothetical protein